MVVAINFLIFLIILNQMHMILKTRTNLVLRKTLPIQKQKKQFR